MDPTSWQNFWGLTIFLFYLLFVFLIKNLNKEEVKLNTNFTKKDSAKTLLSIILGLLLILISQKIGLINLHSYDLNPKSFLSILCYALLIIPIEEILFRGIIQNYFTKRIGIFLGIITGSVIFSLLHLPNGANGLPIVLWNWNLALAAFVGGLIFGFIFEKTKSIIYPIFAHLILGTVYFLFFSEFIN